MYFAQIEYFVCFCNKINNSRPTPLAKGPDISSYVTAKELKENSKGWI